MSISMYTLRQLLNQYDKEEISISKFLEELNKATHKVPVECYEIEFAEWIYRDFYPYRNSLDTFTYQWVRRSGGGILYTAEELFKKFCEEKKTTPIPQ